MIAYIIRRTLYAVPILIGVNMITFVLFFVVNTPDDMARMHLGQKRVTQEAVDKWKRDRGYDRPLLWDSAAEDSDKFTQTIFFQNSLRLFLFDFGRSDSGRDIGYDISQRMWPSLAISVPDIPHYHDRLHHPQDPLRRADPDRCQRHYLRAVLRGKYPRR